MNDIWVDNNKFDGFQSRRQIGKAATLLEDMATKKKYVLKSMPPITNNIQRLWRMIFGGSLPFQNELRIIIQLKQTNNPIALPVLKIKHNKYYVIPYVDNQLKEEKWDKEISSRIGRVIASISEINRPKKWWYFKERAFYYLESTVRNFWKGFHQVEIMYSIQLSNLKQICEEVIHLSSKFRLRMIHGDLSDNNLIVNQNGAIFVIDWEDARLENKAIFLDLVSIAFEYDDFTLNEDIMQSFWSSYETSNIEGKNLEIVLAFSYLVFVFKLMNMKRWDQIFKDKLFNRIKSYNDDKGRLMEFISNYIV